MTLTVAERDTLSTMRSHTFTTTFPSFNVPEFVDLDATGTGLDGITAGTPVAVTMQSDVFASTEAGDAIVTARVVALDTIRLRACAPPTQPLQITVTELI